jgi:hypothetical protein
LKAFHDGSDPGPHVNTYCRGLRLLPSSSGGPLLAQPDIVREVLMTGHGTHSGKCFCGAVQFSVTGQPAVMGFCHCSDCREWSAAPVNALTLWPPEALAITKGADKIATYNRTERALRRWCTTCGGHLFTELPQWNLIEVFAALIPSQPFEPTFHVHYQETVMPMRDGLPKLKDLPGEFGGSGETLPD